MSICNLALIAIGEDPITSLADPYKAAILCSALYDVTRRELLEMEDWKFAKTQASLAASLIAPEFTYTSACPLPADFIRFWDEPEEESPEYEIQNGMLLTNDDVPFQLVYVFDQQDPTTFSPLFVSALAAALAAKLAQPLTQSVDKEQAQSAKVQNLLDRAALSNSQQASSVELDEDIWLRARR